MLSTIMLLSSAVQFELQMLFARLQVHFLVEQIDLQLQPSLRKRGYESYDLNIRFNECFVKHSCDLTIDERFMIVDHTRGSYNFIG